MMDMMALQTMLHELGEEDENKTANGAEQQCLAPSTIAHVPAATKKAKAEGRPAVEAVAQSDIWDEEEVDTAVEREMKVDDGRKRPEFDIAYKQCVGAEDVYLGMGDMDPSSNCCTHIVVKVELPGELVDRIDLEVKNQIIRVRTPTYKLVTYLPCPVEESEGKARWDAKKECLAVTLPILRE